MLLPLGKPVQDHVVHLRKQLPVTVALGDDPQVNQDTRVMTGLLRLGEHAAIHWSLAVPGEVMYLNEKRAFALQLIGVRFDSLQIVVGPFVILRLDEF